MSKNLANKELEEDIDGDIPLAEEELEGEDEFSPVEKD